MPVSKNPSANALFISGDVSEAAPDLLGPPRPPARDPRAVARSDRGARRPLLPGGGREGVRGGPVPLPHGSVIPA